MGALYGTPQRRLWALPQRQAEGSLQHLLSLPMLATGSSQIVTETRPRRRLRTPSQGQAHRTARWVLRSLINGPKQRPRRSAGLLAHRRRTVITVRQHASCCRAAGRAGTTAWPVHCGPGRGRARRSARCSGRPDGAGRADLAGAGRQQRHGQERSSSRYCGVRASAIRCRLMCIGVGSRVGFPASGSVRLA
jgi:hypothetical protein